MDRRLRGRAEKREKIDTIQEQLTRTRNELTAIWNTDTMLPELAKFFGISVDELLGLKNGLGKRGPTPKLQQKIERLSTLPQAQQRLVLQMLDGVLGHAGR